MIVVSMGMGLDLGLGLPLTTVNLDHNAGDPAAPCVAADGHAGVSYLSPSSSGEQIRCHTQPGGTL